MMRGMVIDMNDEKLQTLVQLQAFLDGTIEVDFAVAADERYDFIARTDQRLRGDRRGEDHRHLPAYHVGDRRLSFRGLIRPPICGAMRPAEVRVFVVSDG